MLWSIIKLVLFVAAVAGLAVGANYLMQDQFAGDGIRISLLGYEISLNLLQSVIALGLLAVLGWIAYKIFGLLVAVWKFINGDDTALSRFFARSRETRGYEALAQGMMALASGEGRAALAKAEKADRYLERPELTRLLTAQAAEMAGDRKRAEEAYRAMVNDDKTRFVGVRGIMKQKLAEGDTETAYKLAQKAFALKPSNAETQDLLLSMQTQRQDWSGARETLNAKLKHGVLPRDVYRRRDAVLALSKARSIIDEGDGVSAQEAAISANKLSPDLIPAAVAAAQSHLAKGSKRNAARLLIKCWTTQPHPDLAAAFAQIEPDESAGARLKRFAPILAAHPDDAETRMLEAELHIAAEDFPSARRAMGDLFERDPTARAATLMAAIERGSGASETVVQGWLARAVTAPRGPRWVCDNCQHIHSAWNATCENCDAFDTLAWKRPPEQEVQLPGGAEMLPLLVGAAAADRSPAGDSGGEVLDLPSTDASAATQN